jgi:hypothetical protein
MRRKLLIPAVFATQWRLWGAKGGDAPLKILLALVVALLIVASACFALGVFDGDGVVPVDGIDYVEFTFSGGLRDGLFYGLGSVYFHDGERFSGEFADGRFDGPGAFYSAQGEWNFSGVFLSGEISEGTLITDRGETVTLERGDAVDMLFGEAWLFGGSFDYRGQTGHGTFVFADGSVYTGSFLDGLADGDGTFKDAAGRMIFLGSFSGGLFDGQGTYWSADGWSYEGGFSGGLFHGEGLVTVDGETIRGVWEMGVQIVRYE